MFLLLMSVMLFWDNHICGNVMLFMNLDLIVSLLFWGSNLQDTRGSFDYCSTKTVSKGNVSYCKIHPLHSLFKGCTKGQYNHCIINTFYPVEADCRKESIYCSFTYNGAYTIPCQVQRQHVGGTYSTPPRTSL
jgi:hypothetical protein